VKIGCIGDIHFGAGVAKYGPERLDDQEAVFNAALDLFDEQGCELILIAGDTWDGPLVPPEQYVVFSRAMDPFSRAMDPMCLMVNGNGRHDLATRPVNALHVYDGIERLTVLCVPDVVDFGDVKVGCLPWAPLGKYVAHRNGASRDVIHAEVAELLLNIARGLREDGADILLGHWAVTGTSLPSGLPVDLANEPLLDADALADLGFDAIVMGHIHKSQTFADGVGFYVGSPLPLNHGEAGYEHGCWIYDTDDGPTFHPLKSRYFRTVTLDDYEQKSVEDAIVRLQFTCTEQVMRRLNIGAIRKNLEARGAWRVSIEPTIIRETQARIDVTEDTDDLDAFDKWLDAEHIDDENGVLRERHRGYVEAVPE
jgi:DNA repair protein SbcD/Mre11